MKLFLLCFLIFTQNAFGQTLSKNHHFDKINWTMTLPPEFVITTPEKPKDSSGEEFITNGNIQQKYKQNMVIFNRRFSEITFNYYNFKEGHPNKVTSENLDKFFSQRKADYLEIYSPHITKLLDSATSVEIIAGVKFNKFKMDVLDKDVKWHIVVLGALHNGYYIDIEYSYKNESGGIDISNMLKGSKFGK